MTPVRSSRARVRPPARVWVIVAPVTGLIMACSGASTSTDTATQTLTVFAASSLTEAFTEVGERFEADNREVDVRFQFAGSPALARQIIDGAPADVFASADDRTMTALAAESDALETPLTFARNTLAIVVEPGNPKGVRDLHDLARSDIDVVLCAPEVPCGSLAAQVLGRAGVTVVARSLEDSVKAVVAKVALGEVDAGVAYSSDVQESREGVEGVRIADTDNITTLYQVSLLQSSDHRDPAERFVAFLGSPEGRRILTGHGLMLP